MKIKSLFLQFALSGMAIMLFTGCEGGSGSDSPNVAPAAVSGSSGLEVQNNSDNEANVFFDEVFIGSVGATATGKWSVPHGMHRVRITNAEKSHVVPLQADYNFPSGGRVILELKFVPKTNTAQDYDTKS